MKHIFQLTAFQPYLTQEFPSMDNRWVCFGEILSGMELLNKIEDRELVRPNLIANP